jgi:hypothetical protein
MLFCCGVTLLRMNIGGCNHASSSGAGLDSQLFTLRGCYCHQVCRVGGRFRIHKCCNDTLGCIFFLSQRGVSTSIRSSLPVFSLKCFLPSLHSCFSHSRASRLVLIKPSITLLCGALTYAPNRLYSPQRSKKGSRVQLPDTRTKARTPW